MKERGDQPSITCPVVPLVDPPVSVHNTQRKPHLYFSWPDAPKCGPPDYRTSEYKKHRRAAVGRYKSPGGMGNSYKDKYEQ
jgi:hypothetical protein